jgi:hypothetical protein
MKKKYRDNQEFFDDVRAFQIELEGLGEIEAADEIKDGMNLINGLTDGWAMLLDSLNKVKADFSSSLNSAQKDKLDIFITLTHRAVYRE